MKASRLIFVVVLAAVATMEMVETSCQVKKKFDIAIVVDWRRLRGEKNLEKVDVSATRKNLIERIIDSSQMLEDLRSYDIKMGVFTYNDGVLPQDQFFSDPSEAKSTLEQVLSGAIDLATHQNINKDISEDVRKVKESLRSSGRKKRTEAVDIVLWVTVYKEKEEQEKNFEDMEFHVKEIFKNAKGDVDGIFAIDLTTTGDILHHWLFQTPDGSPGFTARLNVKQTRLMLDIDLNTLFSICGTSVTSECSTCYFRANQVGCVHNRTSRLKDQLPPGLQKYCEKEGSFEEPCRGHGNRSECERVCKELGPLYAVQGCSATTCGTKGTETVRPQKATPGSLFEHCPNISRPCGHPACPTKKGELPPAPPAPTVPHEVITKPSTRKSGKATFSPGGAPAAGKEPTGQLETWHIVVISLGSTAILAIVIIVVVCIVVSARKRRAKRHVHGRPRQHYQSPDRRDSSRRPDTAGGRYDSRLSGATDRTKGDSRFSRGTDRTRNDYRTRSPSRHSVDNRRR